jgi:hypothetical protein
MLKNKSAILLAGSYGVGKSHTAKVIQNKLLGQSSVIIPFADVIRREVTDSLNLPENLMWTKPTPNWMRDMLTIHGNKQKEKYGKSYFADKVLEEFEKSNKEVLIVDDLRFEKEYETITRAIEKTIVIYMGNKVDQYELEKIFLVADFIIPKRPSLRYLIDEFCFLDGLITLRYYNNSI